MAYTGKKLPVAGITSAQPQGHPIYHDDRRVTFVFEAEDANTVQVQIHGDATDLDTDIIDLAKDDEGKWTATIGPVRAGFHYYNMIVDGARCVDQHAEVCWGWGRVMNLLEVPDPEFDFFLPRDVPHGEVRLHYYKSEMTGCLRRAVVYTPPGYDEGDDRYPVFYLQHGSGESERGWTWHGKANFVLDSFIEASKCVPMIMVNDHGYAIEGEMKAPFTEERGDNVFTDLVPEELVPEIDASYRTIADRKHRAMGGLSMGSGQALAIGLTHLDMFAGMPGFALDYSIMPVAAAVVGGMGTFAGPMVGAFILVPLSEFLRALGALRIVFYGLFLVIFVVGLPEGLFHYIQRKYEKFERWVVVE